MGEMCGKSRQKFLPEVIYIKGQMPLRRKEFELKERQNGEGMCWIKFLECYLETSGFTVPPHKEIITALRATSKLGADQSRVVSFLKEKYGINCYAEADCPPQRLAKMLELLPGDVDFVASVWDDRDRGLPRRKDRAESHIVAISDIRFDEVDNEVDFLDFDTYVGGELTWSLEKFLLWWHDGPGAKKGNN